MVWTATLIPRGDSQSLSGIGFADHLIDGETLMGLNDRMIEQLFPVMKTQVRFALSNKTNPPQFATSPNYQPTTNQQPPTNTKLWPTIFTLPEFPTVLQCKLNQQSEDFHSPTQQSKWRSQIIQV
ncbi:hypothetical protein J4Q44_G00117780 [Coregonus suidteri]|uniref:Uncharacterized protein n=1 Tax=Coregonus suidteri TaxID=861788 RepID=A0AAN8R9A9_9TELE